MSFFFIFPPSLYLSPKKIPNHRATQQKQFIDTVAQTVSVKRNLSFVHFTGLTAIYFVSSCKMKAAVTDIFNTTTLPSILKNTPKWAVHGCFQKCVKNTFKLYPAMKE